MISVQMQLLKLLDSFWQPVLVTNFLYSNLDTVAIIQLRTKKELGDRKLKFDWLDFINQGPKFWDFKT